MYDYIVLTYYYHKNNGKVHYDDEFDNDIYFSVLRCEFSLLKHTQTDKRENLHFYDITLLELGSLFLHVS